MQAKSSSPPLNKQQLRLLLERRDQPGLRHCLLHLALITMTGSLVYLLRDSAWLWPTMVIHGIPLVFLFCPLHETIHRTAFASKWMNIALSHLAGILLILPPEGFRAFHFAHHRFTQDPERDPELQMKVISNWPGYLFYLSGLNYWLRAISGLITTALNRFSASYVTEKNRSSIVQEARYYLLIYAALFLLSVLFSSYILLILWLGPAVLAQPFLRAYLLAEHTGCPETSQPELADMLLNTRTTISNPLVRFLAWNMPYHTEHHAYPGVPFYALPKLHEQLKERIQYLSPSYLAFHKNWIRTLK